MTFLQAVWNSGKSIRFRQNYFRKYFLKIGDFFTVITSDPAQFKINSTVSFLPIFFVLLLSVTQILYGFIALHQVC